MGVKDSKSLSETTIRSLAHDIRDILGKKRYDILWISPIKYNLLYKKLGNVNKILGWAHARVVENLLENGIDCDLAIADQFGDPGYIKNALMERGRKIKLVQVPRAEIIIGNAKNWKEVFSKVFRDKNVTIGYLRTIKDIRDRVAHSRCDFFTQEEKIQLIGAISYLRNMMIGQSTLDLYGI